MPAARRLGTHLDFVVVSRRGYATAPSFASRCTHRADARDSSTYPRELLVSAAPQARVRRYAALLAATNSETARDVGVESESITSPMLASVQVRGSNPLNSTKVSKTVFLPFGKPLSQAMQTGSGLVRARPMRSHARRLREQRRRR